MSGLSQAAADARARADVSLDPGDHALANALEGALAAECAEQLSRQSKSSRFRQNGCDSRPAGR